MAGSNFVDYVKICFRTGKGGAGSKHFLRNKSTTQGGPDGGNGGRGGHIILKGNKNLWTLLHLKYRKHIIAKDGEKGGDARKTGAQGQDEILEVPLGTVVKDELTGNLICEITQDSQEIIVAKGGRGGLGNHNFKSATRQAPQYAQPGEEGVEEWKILELKILADVGLVGLPNAGKSTLLSSITAAKPEIADYPFTTIVPQLGIIKYRGYQSFIMADLPGIIEGAHEGKGLGHRFLRHIERNSVLLILVACTSESITEEYKTLCNELKLYNPELLEKPRILAISKTDLIVDDELKVLEKEVKKKLKDVPYIFISSATGKNLDVLKDKLWGMLN